MSSEKVTRYLSQSPYIAFVQLGPTLAHIWYDQNSIDLNVSDISDLIRQIEWTTNGRVLVRTDRIFDGVFELMVAPDYAESSPDTFQQVLDYITLVLRAACPDCNDYQEDRSNLRLPLSAGSTEEL